MGGGNIDKEWGLGGAGGGSGDVEDSDAAQKHGNESVQFFSCQEL